MLQSIYTHAGCDYGCLYTYSPRHCFNPHTHAGCDGSERYKEIEALVSIHTPTQGVTLMLLLSVMWYLSVSIHTPTQGVTTLAAVNSRNPRVSIHTPTQGVTVDHCQHRSFITFQSTHPRRV